MKREKIGKIAKILYNQVPVNGFLLVTEPSLGKTPPAFHVLLAASLQLLILQKTQRDPSLRQSHPGSCLPTFPQHLP